MILYIHIPFCTSRCGYCTFNSFSDADSLKESYVHALCQDIASHSSNHRLSSIFFGGGTPNTLSLQAYEKIFAVIHAHFTLHPSCEITTEANPNLITKHWCKGMQDLGINRLSLGVQSFFEDKLAFLEREHGRQDIYHAMDAAQNAGLSNLSIDLIYDTPLDSPKRLQEELRLASALDIQHLSAYSLSIEENSSLHQKGKKASPIPQHQMLSNTLRQLGFRAYEVSNFARKDHKCRHNLAYWAGEDYIGCGAGAVGKQAGKRLYAHKNLQEYIKNPLFRKEELLSQEDLILEALFLGLRSEVGVGLDLLDFKLKERAYFLAKNQKLEILNNRIFAKNFFLADELALWILKD